ncbi:hypothetical protein [Rhizobium mesoamericanum]|uniref:Transmembrane protein n=1 Tax=Rhizobium mesoamericanum STM3625 TaxID=1211777 RepID=K0PZI1_9HYPH|nr:membrane hypothetical protein [Rhizobium mesoamericanum STM3625]
MQLDTNVVPSEGRSRSVGKASLFEVFLLIYVTSLALLALDLMDGTSFARDVDDQMREVQIRHLLSIHGRWFDLTLPSLLMPEPYVSPWSRLIDLPYVLITKLLQPFVPLDDAVRYAFYVWPPMMLALLCLLTASLVRRLMGSVHLKGPSFAGLLVLMTLLMTFGIAEFAPGRIDHHNAQIVAMMTIMAGLVRWDRVGGAMIGAGSAVSVVIGLECLPFLAAAYAGLVVSFILGTKRANDVLFFASLAMVGTTMAAMFAFIGPTMALSTQCDAFSAPYIFLLIGFSVVLAIGAVVARRRPSTPMFRALIIGAPGLLLLGVAAFLFRPCAGGPYGIIDPLSRELWFDRIWQERSILYFYENGRFDLLAVVAVTTCSAVFALPMIAAKLRRGEVGPLIAFCMAVTALALTFLTTRNIRFPIALVPPFVPAAVAELVRSRRLTKEWRMTGAAIIAVLVGFALPRLVVAPTVRTFDAVDYMAFDECKDQDLGVLKTIAPARIALPQGLALPVLLALPDGFSIGAAPFHRASPGMKRMFEAFRSSDPDIRRQALSPFDYVAVCRFPLEADAKEAPLYAALAAGRSWPGLERVPSPTRTNFQLFRIDHEKLQ